MIIRTSKISFLELDNLSGTQIQDSKRRIIIQMLSENKTSFFASNIPELNLI